MAYRTTRSLGFGFGMTPWVKRLLIANVAVFLLTPVMFGRIFWLEFTPRDLLTQPWTPVTYMFVHGGIWHLLVNMIALFFFGPPLEGRWGSREFLKFYLICGLGGAALSFLFAFNASVVGASAAVFGIMLAFAMNWPDSPIYIWGIFPIKAKWLVGIFIAITLLSAFSGGRGDNIAHFAHLGGLAAGFLYLKLSDGPGVAASRWKPGISDRSGGGKRGGLLDGMKRKMSRLSRPRLTVLPGGGQAEEGDDGRRGRRPREEERLLDEVDRVLDKISNSGLASLTPEERRLLDDVSRRYRRD